MDLGSTPQPLGAGAATAYRRRSGLVSRRANRRRGASATGSGTSSAGMRSKSEFAGLARAQRAPDFLRRSVFPASKSVAKIRRFAEAEGVGDIIDRHLSVAQIFYRHLGPQLVEQAAERCVFIAQFAPERADRDAEMCGDVLQAGVSPQCREQKGPHHPCHADPVLQSIVQDIAKSDDRRVSDFVAELRGAVQPRRINQEAIARLPKRHRACDRPPVLFFGLGAANVTSRAEG